MIENYHDFLCELHAAGFSQFGGQAEVFGLLRFGWGCEDPNDPVRWHTGDSDHDPWQWRMRVLEENAGVAYAKVFFRKAGFITKEWYPYFLAARRRQSFDEAYAAGLQSQHAKRIYDLLRASGPTPAHELGVSKEEKAAHERAMLELQAGLYITVCGQRQKISRQGEAYGWPSDEFCTVEDVWPEEIFAKAGEISRQAAEEGIAAQVLRLNPAAEPKKIRKFIFG